MSQQLRMNSALINIRSDYLHCWLACFNSLERLRESLLSKYAQQLSRELVSVALRYLINSYPSKLRWTIFVAALTFCRINMSWDFCFQFRCLLSSVPVPYLVHSIARVGLLRQHIGIPFLEFGYHLVQSFIQIVITT